MIRFTSAILLVTLVGGIAAARYFVRSNGVHKAITAIRVIHPELRVFSNTVSATGSVRLRPGSEVRVGSQLSGIVRKLNVTVGTQVNAGDIIAEIDDTSIRARVAQVEAQVQVDKATLERAQIDAERAKELGSKDLIPVQQEQDAQLSLEEAKVRYEKSLKDGDLAKVDLSYVQVRAPIKGTVASVSTQEGETVQAAFSAPTFVTIIRDDSLELVAMVDEADIATVRRGNPVSFTVDSYPSREFSGIVQSIAPKATPASGAVNYEVTITITQGLTLLKPDMTAGISIKTTHHEGLAVPQQAIQYVGEKAFVYFASGNEPERRAVVTGGKDGGEIEIKKGLLQSDLIMEVSPE